MTTNSLTRHSKWRETIDRWLDNLEAWLHRRATKRRVRALAKTHQKLKLGDRRDR